MNKRLMILLPLLLMMVLLSSWSTAMAADLRQQLAEESTIEQVVETRGVEGWLRYLCALGHEGQNRQIHRVRNRRRDQTGSGHGG